MTNVTFVPSHSEYNRAMLDIKSTPDFHKNADKKKAEDTSCVICGRGVKEPWKHTVHIFYGFTLVTEREAAELDDNGDLGLWPIVNDCLRKHPEIRLYLIGE